MTQPLVLGEFGSDIRVKRRKLEDKCVLCDAPPNQHCKNVFNDTWLEWFHLVPDSYFVSLRLGETDYISPLEGQSLSLANHPERCIYCGSKEAPFDSEYCYELPNIREMYSKLIDGRKAPGT